MLQLQARVDVSPAIAALDDTRRRQVPFAIALLATRSDLLAVALGAAAGALLVAFALRVVRPLP